MRLQLMPAIRSHARSEIGTLFHLSWHQAYRPCGIAHPVRSCRIGAWQSYLDGLALMTRRMSGLEALVPSLQYCSRAQMWRRVGWVSLGGRGSIGERIAGIDGTQ